MEFIEHIFTAVCRMDQHGSEFLLEYARVLLFSKLAVPLDADGRKFADSTI